jgi:pyridoxamine 5'-phosphate oxidase
MSDRGIAWLPDGPWSQRSAPALADRLWLHLQEWSADRRSVWHTPTVATVRGSGQPELRTVVLRHVSPVDWTLRFHTDRRSAKVADHSLSPPVALHVYDPAQRVQVRISGIAHVHCDDGLADAAWAASQAMSRVCYAQPQPPGEPVTVDWVPPRAVASDDHDARANFAVVVIQATAVDWLHLAADGHRRVLLMRDTDGRVSGHRVAP